MLPIDPANSHDELQEFRTDQHFARELWHQIETIHAVTYFALESTEATAAAGVHGFWRTYFGFRAAPLGACTASTVSAAFFGFAPSMVRRAIPAAWKLLHPDAYLELRARSAAAALRRVVPTVEQQVATGQMFGLLASVAELGDSGGRPLYAANRSIDSRTDPVQSLWQTCTTLREHRGDGHVAALVTSGLSAPEALCLFASDNHVPLRLFETSRGWSARELEQAQAALEARGLVDGHGVSDSGRRLRGDIEQTTDHLAKAPLAALDSGQRHDLLAALASITAVIAASGLIPYPNPIGLPEINVAPDTT